MSINRRAFRYHPRALLLTAAFLTLSANAHAENKGGDAAKGGGKPAAAAHAPAAAPAAAGGHGAAHGAPQHGAQPQHGGQPHHAQNHAGNPHHGSPYHGYNHQGYGHAHHVFGHHDVHRFSHAELGYWRSGRWNNSCRGGQCGWWWYSGGQWYLYDRPTYPYPLVVSSVNFLEPVALVGAPVAQAAPVQVAPPAPAPVAAPPQFQYYCDSPRGYYPQVPSCPAGYREVSAR